MHLKQSDEAKQSAYKKVCCTFWYKTLNNPGFFMIIMSREELKQIGLCDKEAEIYLLLLRLEEALASEIAEKSRISRPHIYDTLAKLIEKGLASYVIKNNKKYFRPASPLKLLDYLKEKEDSIKDIIPNLLKLAEPGAKRPVIEVFEGKEGIKTVLNDALKENKEWLSLGSTGKVTGILPYFIEKFHKQRIKQKMPLRVLFNDDPCGRKRAADFAEMPCTKIKFMEKRGPATTYIYSDKVVIILWHKEKLVAIMIKDKEISNSFRSYFEDIWGQDTRTYRGIEGLKAMWNDVLYEKPEELLVMGGSARSADRIPEFMSQWYRAREKFGMKIRRLFEDTPESRKISSLYSKIPLREHRFTTVEGLSPQIILVYGDKVVISSWDIKNPLLVKIVNKEIADNYRKQFEAKWKISKP
jgi:sugar-specific transcriptional regulator TrmB